MAGDGEHWIRSIANWLQQPDADMPPEVENALQAASSADLETLVEVLNANFEWLAAQPDRGGRLMQRLAARAVQLAGDSSPDSLSPSVDPDCVARLYECLAELSPQTSAHALQILAAQSDPDSMRALAALISEMPPEDWQAVGLALSPLWRAASSVLESFFDQLDTGPVHPATLAVLLDLANYSVRSGRLAVHPWKQRGQSLSDLLGSVIVRLQQLERDPAKFGDSVEQVQRALGDSVALTVSLCDALGLIGDLEAGENLTEVLSLSHRRLQTEAAGALARLGDEAGRQHLIELASDRVARLRAVAYAEELGFAEEIEASLRFPQSLAESELAAWLADADQFGFPPSDVELVDSRSLYWPSFEEPRDCFLFRYTYTLSAGQMSNVGIAGPCVHAFHADLANLPVDDIYAAFAGWQVEHEDIFEVPVTQLNPAQRREADRILEALGDHGFEAPQPIALTFFLGEIALLAIVERDGRRLCAISDGEEVLCFPRTDSPTSMTPETTLCIYRGRKLLRSFNG